MSKCLIFQFVLTQQKVLLMSRRFQVTVCAWLRLFRWCWLDAKHTQIYTYAWVRTCSEWFTRTFNVFTYSFHLTAEGVAFIEYKDRFVADRNWRIRRQLQPVPLLEITLWTVTGQAEQDSEQAATHQWSLRSPHACKSRVCRCFITSAWVAENL